MTKKPNPTKKSHSSPNNSPLNDKLGQPNILTPTMEFDHHPTNMEFDHHPNNYLQDTGYNNQFYQTQPTMEYSQQPMVNVQNTPRPFSVNQSPFRYQLPPTVPIPPPMYFEFKTQGETLKAAFDKMIAAKKKAEKTKVNKPLTSQELVEYEANEITLEKFRLKCGEYIRPRKNGQGKFSVEDFVKHQMLIHTGDVWTEVISLYESALNTAIKEQKSKTSPIQSPPRSQGRDTEIQHLIHNSKHKAEISDVLHSFDMKQQQFSDNSGLAPSNVMLRDMVVNNHHGVPSPNNVYPGNQRYQHQFDQRQSPRALGMHPSPHQYGGMGTPNINHYGQSPYLNNMPRSPMGWGHPPTPIIMDQVRGKRPSTFREGTNRLIDENVVVDSQLAPPTTKKVYINKLVKCISEELKEKLDNNEDVKLEYKYRVNQAESKRVKIDNTALSGTTNEWGDEVRSICAKMDSVMHRILGQACELVATKRSKTLTPEDIKLIAKKLYKYEGTK